jgi:hypothetical protein
MEQPPPADRDGNRPPTRPERWADRDRAFATQIRLSVGERAPERGGTPCSCGGTWRYVLLPHAAHPLWRCLHCGRLHRGDLPIPEEADPPTG